MKKMDERERERPFRIFFVAIFSELCALVPHPRSTNAATNQSTSSISSQKLELLMVTKYLILFLKNDFCVYAPFKLWMIKITLSIRTYDTSNFELTVYETFTFAEANWHPVIFCICWKSLTRRYAGFIIFFWRVHIFHNSILKGIIKENLILINGRLFLPMDPKRDHNATFKWQMIHMAFGFQGWAVFLGPIRQCQPAWKNWPTLLIAWYINWRQILTQIDVW